MNRQSWSVEPGQVAAALFSQEVDDDEKSRIAARIIALMPAGFSLPTLVEGMPQSSSASTIVLTQPNLPTPFDLTRGKPPLPEMSPGRTLVDFVTPRSVVFLARFCPDASKWLTKNPPWDDIPEYRLARLYIEGIVPVNDPAERLCAFAKKYRVSNTCTKYSVGCSIQMCLFLQPSSFHLLYRNPGHRMSWSVKNFLQTYFVLRESALNAL